MPRLSIVIASRHGTGDFEATLASVLQNRPADCEVLVVQPCPYDDPYDLAGEVQFVQAPSDCNDVELLNVGLQHATAEVVHVLSCRIEVTEGWSDAAVPHFDDTSVGCASPTIVSRSDPSQCVAVGIRYRRGGGSRIVRRAPLAGQQAGILGPTIGAAFYRRRALLQLGGFCPDLATELAGVDIALALQAVGWSVIAAHQSVVRTIEEPTFRDLSFQAGRQAERLFWRYASTQGWARSLLSHAVMVAGEVAGNIHRGRVWAHLLGRLTACPACWLSRQHQRRLARVRAGDLPSPAATRRAA